MGTSSRIARLAGAALVVGVLTFSGAASDSAAAATSCQMRHPFLTDLKATKTSCKEARRVAEKWQSKAVEGDSGTVKRRVNVNGFTCVHSSPTTRCTKRAQRVTFNFSY